MRGAAAAHHASGSTRHGSRSGASQRLARFLDASRANPRLTRLMKDIVFYEKPGCRTNSRQKAMLLAAGHTLEVRDLLRWPWDAKTLLAFLAPLRVAEWFNRSAPQVKSGHIVPEALDDAQALKLLLAHPLLIRRPLMSVGEQRLVGFDTHRVYALLGLDHHSRPDGLSLEGCSQGDANP